MNSSDATTSSSSTYPGPLEPSTSSTEVSRSSSQAKLRSSRSNEELPVSPRTERRAKTVSYHGKASTKEVEMLHRALTSSARTKEAQRDPEFPPLKELKADYQGLRKQHNKQWKGYRAYANDILKNVLAGFSAEDNSKFFGNLILLGLIDEWKKIPPALLVRFIDKNVFFQDQTVRDLLVVSLKDISGTIDVAHNLYKKLEPLIQANAKKQSNKKEAKIQEAIENIIVKAKEQDQFGFYLMLATLNRLQKHPSLHPYQDFIANPGKFIHELLITNENYIHFNSKAVVKLYIKYPMRFIAAEGSPEMNVINEYELRQELAQARRLYREAYIHEKQVSFDLFNSINLARKNYKRLHDLLKEMLKIGIFTEKLVEIFTKLYSCIEKIDLGFSDELFPRDSDVRLVTGNPKDLLVRKVNSDTVSIRISFARITYSKVNEEGFLEIKDRKTNQIVGLHKPAPPEYKKAQLKTMYENFDGINAAIQAYEKDPTSLTKKEITELYAKYDYHKDEIEDLEDSDTTIWERGYYDAEYMDATPHQLLLVHPEAHFANNLLHKLGKSAENLKERLPSYKALEQTKPLSLKPTYKKILST